jgi:plastocyanin
MKWIAKSVPGLVLPGVIGLAAIACQAPSGPVAGANSVEIVMTEMRFGPNRIDARVGQPIVIRIFNRGAQPHDLTFPSAEMPGLRGVETLMNPGESTTLTLTFDRPGSYQFLCSIPGHAVAGMTGAVFVSP